MATIGTIATIRAELRQRVGYTTDTILLPNPAAPATLSPSESPLDIGMAAGLREVNKHFPTYGIGSFLTVADQQAYSILPVGAQEVVDVFWVDDACALVFAAQWPAALGAMSEALGMFSEAEGGLWFSASPSAILIAQRHRAALEAAFGRRAVQTSRSTVYLIPTPSSAGTSVFFVYSTDRYDSPDEIDDNEPGIVDVFWARAEQKVHSILATGAGAVKRVRGPDGTAVDMDVASHHRAAQDAEQRFVDQLQLAPSWWSTL